MTTLESIVLPLAESRALVDAGIVLDTAMSWYPIDSPEDAETVRQDLGEKFVKHEEFVFMSGESNDAICPAPVLSELLDAIRVKHPDAQITSRCTWPGAAWVIRYGDDGYKNAYGDTVILAAAALLLEVSR